MDTCPISTRKETTEKIRTKIKRKRQEYNPMSGKRKLFPLSLPLGLKSNALPSELLCFGKTLTYNLKIACHP